MIEKNLAWLQDKPIVFYDGTCGFCQASVQFVLRHNKKSNLYFAPLQSGLLQAFLPDEPVKEPLPDAIFFYEKGQVYAESEAALRIAHHLDFPFSGLSYLRVIPASVRNLVYRFVARNRYRIAGRSESCVLPSPGQRARFVGQ